MTIRYGFLASIVAALSVAQPAAALVFCVAARSGRIKSGAAVRVRESCSHNEVALPFSIADGGATVRFTGVNVQIVDGSGDTAGDTNGKGNLIVGYNEETPGDPNVRTGSHNLVVGPEHTWTSWGGLIAGYGNRATGPGASVCGGEFNEASGDFSSVTGGLENVASGDRSSVTGGEANIASSSRAAVTGGRNNQAIAFGTSVTGGDGNTAGSTFASVNGGRSNFASGSGSTVSGGFERSAADDNDWRGGSLLEDE